MPFSLSTIRCRLDPDLDAALFDYQERLGEQLLAVRAQLATVRSLGESVTSAFSEPLRRSLDAALASANTSTEGLIDALRLVDGETPADVETTIGDRFGIDVVNGRLLLPGDRDLTEIQRLSRLVGGFDEVFSLFPELAELPVSDDSDSRYYVSPVEIVSRFVLITTYLRRTVTPATSCTPEVAVTEEITLGVDMPLGEAAALANISVDDLRIYVFWLGIPFSSEATRRKARILGLSSSQIVDLLAGVSGPNFFVSVIPDPVDISRVAAAFGPEASEVVRRATRPLELFPSADSMALFIRERLRSSVPGSSGPSGFSDFSSPAVALLSVLDISKTFGLNNLLSALDSSGDNDSAQQYAEALAATIQSQLMVLETVIAEAQAVIRSVLTEIINLVSLVNTLFNDMANGLLDCLFGRDFSPVGGSVASVGGSVSVGVGGIGGPGSPGTPGSSTSNPFDDILSLIETQASLVSDFFRAVSNLLGLMSDVSCGSSFVDSSSSLGSFSSDIPCQSDALTSSGVETPPEVQEVLGVSRVVMDVLTSLFDTVRTSLRGLRLTVSSLSISLRVSLERRNSAFSASSLPSPPGSPGCAPPEATRLAALLVARAVSGFSAPGAEP